MTARDHGTLLRQVLPGSTARTHRREIDAARLHRPLRTQISPVGEMPGADPQTARAFFAAAAGPEELPEIDGGHFGLLHRPSSWFDEASTAQRRFLQRALL